MSQFATRQVLQAVCVVKAMCRHLSITPLSVELVRGTSAEKDAWEKEAEKYLIAKSKGVKYKPERIEDFEGMLQ